MTEVICEEMDALRLLYEAVDAVEDGSRREILDSLIEETQHRLRELLDEYGRRFLRPSTEEAPDPTPLELLVQTRLGRRRS